MIDDPAKTGRLVGALEASLPIETRLPTSLILTLSVQDRSGNLYRARQRRRAKTTLPLTSNREETAIMVNATIQERNFICPETEAPCVDKDCKLNFCRLRQINDERSRWRQEKEESSRMRVARRDGGLSKKG